MKNAEERFQFASLPIVADLEDTQVRQRVMALLESLDEITARKHELQLEEDDCLEELQVLQKRTGRTGFRHGWLCYAAQEVKGRRTLDKMLLMENGCPGSVIEASYKQGAPSVRQTFKRLTEEDADGRP